MSDKELIWTLKNGDLDSLQTLLKEEDVNRTLDGGRTPLHYASDSGDVDTVKFLLGRGADVNLKDKHGITPLLTAVYECHTGCVEILLSKGADKTVKGPDGLTPLEAAETDTIRALLK